MTSDAPRKPRKSLLVNLALSSAVLLLPAGYVLSYAPVYRLKYGPSEVRHIPIMCVNAITYDATGRPKTSYGMSMRWNPISIYRPVEFLIDETPLGKALLFWAGLFGVREDFEFGCIMRTMFRLSRNP